jgi:hypothetical protein
MTDCVEIVSDQTDDACRIDEYGRRMMECCKLTDARCKLLFATEDDILLLHVRRKTALVECRARRRASSNIPSIAGAAYWSVDEMKGIRQGIKDDSGSGIDTCPLAYGSRKTLIATGE